MSNDHKFEHSHDHTNVDPCLDFIQYTSITTWGDKTWVILTNTQGLHLVFHKIRFYPCDYNDLKSNMVETDYQSMMWTINKCERDHHWCQWFWRYPSTKYWVWIDDLMLNTQSSLSIKGKWCEPMSRARESIIEAYRSQGTKFCF